MARKMAGRTVVAVLVVMVLALQWKGIQARSMPGDYDTQEYVPTDGAFEGLDPQDPFPEQADPASFNADSFAEDFSDAPTGNTWDSDAFSTEELEIEVEDDQETEQSTDNFEEGASYATAEAEMPLDTFVDSPETVTTQDSSASLAGDSAVEGNTQAEHENDEVFFDTFSEHARAPALGP